MYYQELYTQWRPAIIRFIYNIVFTVKCTCIHSVVELHAIFACPDWVYYEQCKNRLHRVPCTCTCIHVYACMTAIVFLSNYKFFNTLF